MINSISKFIAFFVLGTLVILNSNSCMDKKAPDLSALNKGRTTEVEDTTTITTTVVPTTTAVEETTSQIVETTVAEVVTETVVTQINISSDNPSQVLEQTQPPKIYEKKNISPTTFCIAGHCEPNAKITIKGGKKEVSYISDDKYFMGLVELNNSGSTTLEVTAKSKGKSESESIIVTGKYSPGVEQTNNDFNVVVGANYQCHFVSALPDYTGTNNLPNNQITSLKERISSRTKWLKSDGRDMELIYVILPNPMTIYPETVPTEYIQNVGQTRTQQFVTAAQKGGATVIDMTEIFKLHKNDELKLFHKTDSHWTEYGAWIAYTELMNHISKKFPDASPRTFDEMGFYTKDVNGGDMPYYLNMDAKKVRELAVFAKPKFETPTKIKKFLSSNDIMMSHEETPNSNDIKTDRPNLPSAIVMRDSFGIAMYDILPERFNRTYYQNMWNYDFNQSFIDSIKPDYIIYLVAERNIAGILY